MSVFNRLFFILALCLIFNIAKVQAEPQKLMANIPPIASLMQHLVGDLAEVQSLVSSTDNAELFEPTPKQLLQFSKTRLYFTTGLPFERKWLQVIEHNYPQVEIIECCHDLQHAIDSHHHDPHLWTDPLITLEISQRLQQILVGLFPESKFEIDMRYNEIAKQLVAIDLQIRQDIDSIKNPVFFVAHPAWSYFAERYGLQQRAIEHEGKEVGINTRVDLIKHAQENNIKNVFTQSQINPKSARLFAAEINATVIELNPLAYNHIQNLQIMSEQIIGSMK